MKKFHKAKVISRNFITDWIQGIRNMFGLELKGYTNVINKGINEMMEEIPKNTKWYKIDVEELQGAFMILVYGETK